MHWHSIELKEHVEGVIIVKKRKLYIPDMWSFLFRPTASEFYFWEVCININVRMKRFLRD